MYHGSIVALVTPMLPSGEVDFEAYVKLIDWHIASGTQAIVVLGTTGENVTLTFEERTALIEKAIDQVQGRLPVIVGTGTNSTAKTIAFTKQAMQLGADAALVVTPYYNKPTQEGLYQHFKAVSEAASLPIILYNVPSRTGCDMLPETIARLAPLSNIVALKEATGSIERLKAILGLTDQIDLLSGDDKTALDFMLHGGQGVISVVANIIPKQMRELCDAVLHGDANQAATLNAKLVGLYDAMSLESNPIPIKWALAKIGRIHDGIRLPLTPLAQQYHEQVSSALVSLNIK